MYLLVHRDGREKVLGMSFNNLSEAWNKRLLFKLDFLENEVSDFIPNLLFIFSCKITSIALALTAHFVHILHNEQDSKTN